MLTKRKALEKTIEMWSWLAENPDKNKSDYFYCNGIEETPEQLCYCCEYNPISCYYCPIQNWAYNDDEDVCKCDLPRGTYELWRDSSTQEDAKKYAQKIVLLAKKSLINLANKDYIVIDNKEYDISSFKKYS
ncbi:MAG: hypothetical protein K2K42_03805, partial [Eubacterium sp.]|nr:hypothetical protein [Eubacterium sp.]